MTSAFLKHSGNIPSERDRFMILVIGVARMSIQSLTRDVGQGSRSHDLFGEEEMSFFTSSSETGVKEDSCGGVLGGGICSPSPSSKLKAALIFVILSLKKEPKELAKSDMSEQSGRGLASLLCKMRLILFQSFLGLFLFLSIILLYQLLLERDIR